MTQEEIFNTKSLPELLRLAAHARQQMAEVLLATSDMSPGAIMGYGDFYIELKMIQEELRRRRNARRQT
jgi:hypothetical protein